MCGILGDDTRALFVSLSLYFTARVNVSDFVGLCGTLWDFVGLCGTTSGIVWDDTRDGQLDYSHCNTTCTRCVAVAVCYSCSVLHCVAVVLQCVTLCCSCVAVASCVAKCVCDEVVGMRVRLCATLWEYTCVTLWDFVGLHGELDYAILIENLNDWCVFLPLSLSLFCLSTSFWPLFLSLFLSLSHTLFLFLSLSLSLSLSFSLFHCACECE